MNNDILDKLNGLNKIDVKDLMKNKEFLAFSGVIVFIIGIIVAANVLLSQRANAISERDMAKAKLDSILAEETDMDKLYQKIEDAEAEISDISRKIEPITQKEVVSMLSDFESKSGISWSTPPTYSARAGTKEENFEGIIVNVKNYTGSYENVKSFMRYATDCGRKISIDSIAITRDKLTGMITGSFTMTFYMEKQAA